MTKTSQEIATTVATVTVAILALWASAIQPLRETVDRLDREGRELREIVKERSIEAGAMRERIVALEEQQRLREFEIMHGKGER